MQVYSYTMACEFSSSLTSISQTLYFNYSPCSEFGNLLFFFSPSYETGEKKKRTVRKISQGTRNLSPFDFHTVLSQYAHFTPALLIILGNINRVHVSRLRVNMRNKDRMWSEVIGTLFGAGVMGRLVCRSHVEVEHARGD